MLHLNIFHDQQRTETLIAAASKVETTSAESVVALSSTVGAVMQLPASPETQVT